MRACKGFPGGSVGKESACSAWDLEEVMATHSSMLAWEIPWIEEPGGLQSTGLQRVRQDWATKHGIYEHAYIYVSPSSLIF